MVPRQVTLRSRAPQCPICLEKVYSGKTKLDCKCPYVFHKSCVDKWLGVNRECPMCRAKQVGVNDLDADDISEIIKMLNKEEVSEAIKRKYAPFMKDKKSLRIEIITRFKNIDLITEQISSIVTDRVPEGYNGDRMNEFYDALQDALGQHDMTLQDVLNRDFTPFTEEETEEILDYIRDLTGITASDDALLQMNYNHDIARLKHEDFYNLMFTSDNTWMHYKTVYLPS